MAYCIMRTEKIKTMGAFAGKNNHNFRIGNVPNADKERAHLNRILIPMKDESYSDAFKRIMSENHHQPRSNAVLGIEVMLSYNANEVDKDFDIDKWCEANVMWLKEQFGEENVVSAVLHRDEGPTSENTKYGAESGHIHAIIIPMVDGKLNARHYLAGRAKLHEMQTSYGKAMEPLGLERGLENSVASHDKVQKMYASINKVFDEHLPSPEKDESIEEYSKRVDEIYIEERLKHLSELKKKDREIVEIKTKGKNAVSIDDTLSLQNSLALLEKQKQKLDKREKELEEKIAEFEKMSAGNESTMKKLKNFEYLEKGLKEYPDREKARKAAEEINVLVRWAHDSEIGKNKENEEKR